jgi:hypothetical protein
MAQINSLPQETLIVDDVEYLVTAMPATAALAFQEKQLQKMVDAQADKAKVDLSEIKQIVCKYAFFEGLQITSEKFDVHFARKTGHLNRLFEAILDYNFPKEGNDSED